MFHKAKVIHVEVGLKQLLGMSRINNFLENNCVTNTLVQLVRRN